MALSATSARLTNLFLYNVGWFACVLGAGEGRPQAGALAGLGIVAVHLALSRRRRDEIALAGAASLIGIIVDTVQIWLGTVTFPTGVVVAGFPPPWMVILWAQLANTLHFSSRWILGRPRLAALAGALGGPLAFWAGAGMGAIQLDARLWPSFLSLAIAWAGAVPVLVWLATRQAGRPHAGEYGRALGPG